MSKGSRRKPKSRAKPKARAERDPASLPKPTRDERLAEVRRGRRRRTLVTRAATVAVIVSVLGAGAVWQIGNRRDESQAVAAMTAGSCSFDRKSDPGRVNEHASDVSFRVEPPSGGVHTAGVATPGVLVGGGAPPDGQVVHALEHGDIVVWYRPGLREQEVDALRELVESRADDLFLIERPNLPAAVAATAWHKRLLCSRVELPALRRFVTRYVDKGPERQSE